jgi:predicted enzyme related to lactoylglutathione lyase
MARVIVDHLPQYLDVLRSQLGPLHDNYRVSDLTAVLAELRGEGCAVDDRIEESAFGRFGWVQDPEGNRVELWEPPAGTSPG